MQRDFAVFLRDEQVPPAGESTPQGSLQVGPRSEAPAPPNLPPPHVFLAWLGLKFARHKNYMQNGQNVLGD